MYIGILSGILSRRLRHLEVMTARRGAALDRAPLVERREAPPPHQRGRRPPQPPAGPIARLRQSGSRKPAGAPRRSIPAAAGRKKGKRRARAANNRAGGALFSIPTNR